MFGNHPQGLGPPPILGRLVSHQVRHSLGSVHELTVPAGPNQHESLGH